MEAFIGSASQVISTPQAKLPCVSKTTKTTKSMLVMSMNNRKSRFGFGKFFNNKNNKFNGKNNNNNNGGFNGNGNGNNNDNNGNFAASSGGGDKSSNPLLAFWAGYNSALESKPILIKALTSLVGFALGDALAQKFLGAKDQPFDWARLGRMAAFGFLLHGTTGHFFYGALDRAIPGTEAWKVAAKVAIDQILWAPIFTVMFFSFIGAAEGRSVKEITEKVKRDLWTGVTASWKVWPFVHAINFRFIPTSQRLLYINSIQILYNVFLSMIANKKVEAPAPPPAAAPVKGKKK